MARLTFTVREAADAIGISPWLYRRLAAEGKLPILHLGRRTLVPRAALEEHLRRVGAA